MRDLTLDAHKIRFKLKRLRGKDSVVKTWEEFAETERVTVLKGATPRPNEEPVVGIAEGDSPLLITTKRIYWMAESSRHTLDLDEIAKVEVPDYFISDKSNLRTIRLTTRDGQVFRLNTPPGDPLFIIWNLLLGILPPLRNH